MTVLLFLFLLPSSSGSLPPPRSSFLLDSGLRPMFHFSLPDVHCTTTLLLSPDASTLYVGAQNILLSLDVSRSDVISLRKQVPWSPTEDNIQTCLRKGKKAVDCLNFIHVLQQMNSSLLYACGSFAFNPQEAYIDSESLSVVHSVEARGRCPFSPLERSSAVFLDGELFAATTIDFRGSKPQISRFFSRHGRPDVSLDSSISLLEEPTFVSSWSDPSQRKIYFFFSEVGKEFDFVEKLQIARVAQVCKDDVGGQRTLQKKWTSFAKAPLLCQFPKQLPFNVLQDVFPLQPQEDDNHDDTLFYGVFTSQWSTVAESAVCVFTLRDIRAKFAGSYRTFNMQSHQWSPLEEKHSYLGQCGLANSSDSELEEVKKSFLTAGGGVKPSGGAPLVVSSEHSYNRIAAMRTRAADGQQHIVLFLLTESGFLHKVLLSESGPRIIEEIQVCTKPEVVQSLVLSPAKGVLYVGTSGGVASVPVAHCAVHRTCSQCVLARDPLCGWNRTRRACTGLSPGLDGGPEELVQNLDGGNVDQDCGRQRAAEERQEVLVVLGEVVTLRCQKPSKQASVSWTSSSSKVLSKKFFIQSADGSLQFLATADTVGTYSCEAKEGGHREVVSSYQVQQAAAPRSLEPLPKGHDEPDEPIEVFVTENPESVGQPATEHDGKIQEDIETVPSKKDGDSDSLTFKQDSWSVAQSVPAPLPCGKLKSYHSELVVVSLLLVACVTAMFLGLFYLWCQRRNQREKPSGILEGCTLSGPEDQGPDLKVEL